MVHKIAKKLKIVILLVPCALIFLSFVVPVEAFAAPHCGGGAGETSVTTSIDIGCRGIGNPIADAAFAIIRFLSDGVGLVIIASLIWGGIQYSASRGDPQATASAIDRLRANIVALLIFIFSYAILNYIIPAGFLK